MDMVLYWGGRGVGVCRGGAYKGCILFGGGRVYSADLDVYGMGSPGGGAEGGAHVACALRLHHLQVRAPHLGLHVALSRGRCGEGKLRREKRLQGLCPPRSSLTHLKFQVRVPYLGLHVALSRGRYGEGKWQCSAIPTLGTILTSGIVEVRREP